MQRRVMESKKEKKKLEWYHVIWIFLIFCRRQVKQDLWDKLY